jgi:hypothetical protein
MNKTKLNKYLKIYKNSFVDSAVSEIDAQKEREERIAYYQQYTKERVLYMTETEFMEYIGKLWASLTFSNKNYLVNRIITSNGG